MHTKLFLISGSLKLGACGLGPSYLVVNPPLRTPSSEKDGCTLAVADTADVQKEWMASMQDQGMCSCDEEHMFSCGKEDQDEDPVSNNELRDVIQSLLHDKVTVTCGDCVGYAIRKPAYFSEVY